MELGAEASGDRLGDRRARLGVAIGVGGHGRGRRHPRADVEVPGHHDEPDQLAERHRAHRLHRRRDRLRARDPRPASSGRIPRGSARSLPAGRAARRRAAPAASPRRTHPSRSRLHGRNRRPPGRHEFASVASDAVVGGAEVGAPRARLRSSAPPSPGRSRRRRATARRSPRGRGSGGSARRGGRPRWRRPGPTCRARRRACRRRAAGPRRSRPGSPRRGGRGTAGPPRSAWRRSAFDRRPQSAASEGSSQCRAHASSASDGGRDDSEVANRRTR